MKDFRIRAGSTKATLFFATGALVLSVIFTNCSAPKTFRQSTNSSGGGSVPTCTGVNAAPTTIAETVTLINSLPRPLTLDCFLNSLAKPLNIFAVDNTFSAQPSAGPNNPRIFIILPGYVMSVVPAGAGSSFVEMSELTSANSSVKAEIDFPIAGPLHPSEPFTRILNPNLSGATSCNLCHANESPMPGNAYPGPAFVSNIVRPDSNRRVSSSFLKQQSQTCNPAVEAYRCAILKAIFQDGQGQDAAFP